MGSEMCIRDRWNFVAPPFELISPYVRYNFPDAIGNVYYYNTEEGLYEMQGRLEVGRGYWLLYPSSSSVTINGENIEEITLNLSEGWNAIGGLNEPVSLEALEVTPEGSLVEETLYWWDPSEGTYQEAAVILPGQGYWIYAIRDCQVTIAAEGSGKVEQSNLQPKQNELLRVTSENCQFLKLNLGNSSNIPALPLPPETASCFSYLVLYNSKPVWEFIIEGSGNYKVESLSELYQSYQIFLDGKRVESLNGLETVSYTHLTLPTN